MINQKKGQVFLMAAVIIAGLVLGATKIVNSAKSGNDQEAFYDLTEEIDFETKRVLDVGIIDPAQFPGNSFDLDDIEDFLEKYNEYIGGEEVVFIFGDSTGQFNAIYYQNFNTFAPVSLNTGGATSISQSIIFTNMATATVTRDTNTQTVTVKIRGIDYTFDLRPGQNFYFVLIKDENGEKFVAAR